MAPSGMSGTSDAPGGFLSEIIITWQVPQKIMSLLSAFVPLIAKLIRILSSASGLQGQQFRIIMAVFYVV